MLKDNLYIIKNITTENNIVEASVELNDEHEIFKGHFPTQPVLPGACMLQMIKEITATSLNKKIHLIKASEIKFLLLIIPDKTELLQFLIQYNFITESTININAKIMKDEAVCCKMKASFQIK
ncbi:MAG: 3-hydroxyacyl-ACP dehydratase [Parafilimonas sp.]